MTTIRWLDEPQKHDYVAAETYLSLTDTRPTVKPIVRRLRKAKMTQFAAKDIFRASGLSLLGISNGHVENDRAAILRGEELSPILLCRNASLAKLIIADGYHRLCAVYSFNEDAMIPCKIA